MATLKAQITADIATVIAPDTLVDLTNQRGTGSTQDSDIIERAAAYAAAKVEGAMGTSIDSDDADFLECVEIGVNLAMLNLTTRFTVLFQPGGTPPRQQVLDELEELKQRRKFRLTRPVLYSQDNEALDRRYNQSTWEDEV